MLTLSALFALADMLPTTIMHPSRLTFYSIYPTDTSVKDLATFTFSQTNDYEKEPVYYLDYELSALTIVTQKKLAKRRSIRFIVPLFYIWGGFMDPVLDQFHKITGTLHGYRHNEDGKNRVHFYYGYAHKSSPYATLGNVQIEFKQRFEALELHQAFICGIKLPTSSKSKGFGSGKTDLMLGWVAQKGDFTLNLNITYVGSFHIPSASARRFQYFATLGWRHGNWLVDYRFASSPFSSSYTQLDSPSNIVDVAYQKGRWRFFASENLSPFYNSPDFTLGVVYRF
jgi:hypothetical protein